MEKKTEDTGGRVEAMEKGLRGETWVAKKPTGKYLYLFSKTNFVK